MSVATTTLRSAWGDFFTSYGGQFAVTCCYNPHRVGTAGPCYRITTDGECLRLKGSGISARYGGNRISGTQHVPLEQVQNDLTWLHGRVDRALFGTRFHKVDAALRTAYLGCIEHQTSNLHVHTSWRVPASRIAEFPSVIAEAWREVSPAATIDVQPIRDAEKWGRYLAKDCWGTTPDNAALFVTSTARA